MDLTQPANLGEFIASARRCRGFSVFWATSPLPQELRDYVDEFEGRHARKVPSIDTDLGDWIRPWEAA